MTKANEWQEFRREIEKVRQSRSQRYDELQQAVDEFATEARQAISELRRTTSG